MESRPTPPPPLRLVFWELTARCNLRCRHCRRLAPAGPEGADGCGTPEALRLVDQVAAFTPAPILVLSGGEPLLRQDLFEIARHGTHRGLTVSLATNGTLVDEQCAARLAACGVARVAVSLDGPDAPAHDELRGAPGAFEAALKGLRCLRTQGLSVQLNCTLTNRTAHLGEAFFQLAEREGADALHFFVLVPVGCGLELAETHRLSARQVEDFLTWLAGKARGASLHLKATCAPQYFRIIRQQGGGGGPRRAGAEQPRSALEAETRGCLAGSAVCFISYTGHVFPCGYLPLKAGNVREQTLREVWERSPVLQEFREGARLEGRCGRCGFKRVCFGCRARALGVHGNVWAEDPYCAYAPPEPAPERRPRRAGRCST